MPTQLSTQTGLPKFRIPHSAFRISGAWLIAYSLPLTAFSQPIIYVNDDATGSNNGSSWAHAYVHLQDALSAAQAGNQVWVAAGVYRPDRSTADPDGSCTPGPCNRSATFVLIDDVALYGGFEPGDTNLDQQNVDSNATILSGDIDSDGTFANNAFHVATGSGRSATAILDGFTITGGNANGPATDSNGGGLLNKSGAPTVSNCRFINNQANAGGGIYNAGSTQRVTNCKFINNTAGLGGAGGGGIWNDGSSPIITDCVFSGNASATGPGGGAFSGGAGMYNLGSSPEVRGCSFAGNHSDTLGGGIKNFGGSSPTLTDCTFTGNTSSDGAGMYNNGGTAVLMGCRFEANIASANGGGVFNVSTSTTMTNCEFVANEAPFQAGALYSQSSQDSLTGCRFTGNLTQGNGGAFSCSATNTTTTAPVRLKSSADPGR